MNINNRKVTRSMRGAIGLWVLVVVAIAGLLVGYVLHGLLTPSQRTATTAKATRWTCSMHPQIILPKPGRCPLCNMDLIPLQTQGAAAGLRELTISEDARKLMAIQTAPVERKFVDVAVRMVGKIDYDETRLKYITAWLPGRLDRLYVDYTGVPVRKGDHLVSLYSPELLSAQEELLQALETVRDLTDRDSAVMRQMSTATLEAAREKLRLWGLKPEQIAEIERRGETTDHMTIYSPIGGIVIHKNAQEGMYVKTGTKIYTIADLSQVWVRLDAYESDLQWLRYGQKVEFTAEAAPGERFAGVISFIDPVLTQATRTVKVRLDAANSQMKLKPGMFVRAVAKAKVASAGKVMDAALAGKWICPMHPSVIRDAAGECDICEMPLERTETLNYLGLEPTESDRPLVIPASAVLWTGTRAIVYVEFDPSLLRPYDVTDWGGLLVTFRSAAGEGPVARLLDLLSNDLRGRLTSVAPRNVPTQDAQDRFVREINEIIQGNALYDAAVWQGFEFDDEVEAMLARGAETLSAAERMRFNRLLLAALLPNAITQPRKGPTFEGREIILGPRAGEYYLVRHGLAEGERVVTKGSFKLDAELQIQAKPSMMTPEGGGGGGHEHGAPAAGSKEPGDKPMAMTLPAAVQAQLHAVLSAGKDVNHAMAAGDVDAVRSEFGALAKAIGAVEPARLKGHMRLLWKEHSMLLTNDAVEGEGSQDLSDAQRAAAMMNQHLATMSSSLGLADPSPPHTMKVDKAFREQLGTVIQGYLAIQQALANDDASGAQAAIANTLDALAAVDASGLDHEADAAWTKISGELKRMLSDAAEAKDIRAVRKVFALLSEEMAAAVQRLGRPGGRLLQFRCPMAFNNRGATWLQTDEQTRNPYFGSAMLGCGQVISDLSANDDKGAGDE